MKKRRYLLSSTACLLAAAVLMAGVCAGCTRTPAAVSSRTDSESLSNAQATAQVSSMPAKPSSGSSGQTSSAAAKPPQNKAQGETVFDVNKYKEQIKNAKSSGYAPSYRYDGMTLESTYENSFAIADCQVEKVEFVVILNGQPHTKLDVKVIESFKGDFKPGDHITVYVDGGYITADEYIKTRELESRFPNLTQEQRANTIYEMKCMDAYEERYAQVGDRYIFGLRNDELLGYNYFPTMGTFTTYRRDASGRYTRRPDQKAKEGIKVSGNSDESFTLDWFRSKMNELAKGSM